MLSTSAHEWLHWQGRAGAVLGAECLRGPDVTCSLRVVSSGQCATPGTCPASACLLRMRSQHACTACNQDVSVDLRAMRLMGGGCCYCCRGSRCLWPLAGCLAAKALPCGCRLSSVVGPGACFAGSTSVPALVAHYQLVSAAVIVQTPDILCGCDALAAAGFAGVLNWLPCICSHLQ